MEISVILLILLQSLCISRTQGFNVGTAGAKIFSGSAGEEFGYTVQQLNNDQGKWLVVGSPWSGSPQDRKGDLYKCDIGNSRSLCEKLNLQESVKIDGVQNININMSLGLTLTPIRNRFLTCAPLWAQRCGTQYFYPGVCAELSSRFALRTGFAPAVQSCGGPVDVAIVLDGSNSIYPWPDVTKFLKKLLEHLDIGPDQTRVSIMQYSEDLSVLYSFSSNQIKENVISAASAIEQKTGLQTNTFDALDKVRLTAFRPENGGRPNATKVLVVVTDGESSDGHRGQEVMNRFDDSIVRFGIAILKKSANIKKFIEEIELIASTPTENYMFNVSSEQALVNIAGTLGDRIFNIEGTSQGQEFQLEMSQVGFSAHQTKKKNEVMLGAVGAFGWSGTVVHHTADESYIFPKNTFEKVLDDRNHSSLLGYSVSSVTDGLSEFFVAGAPRAVHRGQVVIYKVNNKKQAVVIDSQRGDQIGSYFGSVLCPVDVDADGVTDLLLVGAPMYMNEEKGETGRVYIFTVTKGLLNKEGSLEGPPVLENARFGTAITAVPDLNLDGFTDVVVGAPMEDNGRGAIYIYYGDKKTIRKQSSQKILGSKLDPALRFFGRSLDSRMDLNSDTIPDISVGGAGKVVQLWSRGIASITTTISFSPEKINIQNKTCQFGGRMVPCVAARVCFRSSFKPYTLGKVDIKYNLTLDADLQSSRAISRAQFDNSERLLQKTVSVFDIETCVDHKVNVQETPDFVSPVALRVDVSLQNPDAGPVLDAFQAKAWESFVPFVKDCGSDDKCMCDLKLTVKPVEPVNVRSSSLLVGPDRKTLSFMVTVTNMKENAYNTRLSANFSSNLFYASVTPSGNNTEVKCTLKTASLDCQVGYPALTPGQTVTFKINFDFNLNQRLKNAAVDFEVRSDSEEEVTSDNKVSHSIPVQYDTEIILTRAINMDYCTIDAKDQVKNTVTNFDDIGPEIKITLQVTTGTFPINQAYLKVSLPTRTKAGNPLLYVTSVKTSAIANVFFNNSSLIDPLNIRGKTHTASFTKESFKGTKLLNCKEAKCELMTWVLENLEMKTNYIVNITTRIWNGTFASADFQTVLVAGSSEIETSQPDLLVITHKEQQIKITVSKEKGIGNIPIGIIIGSVLGGLILFALVTVVLWQVGFFKRKQLPQQGNEADPAEQEGLCENTA